MKDLKLDDVYVFLLERTTRQFRKYAKQELKRHNIYISGEQWVALKTIYDNNGINQRELAESTYKDPASITRILDILEKQHYVKRESIDGNRRTHSLSVTSEGGNFVKKVIPYAKKIRAKGLTNISDKDLETLNDLLNKIYNNFN